LRKNNATLSSKSGILQTVETVDSHTVGEHENTQLVRDAQIDICQHLIWRQAL